jgi:hypothetical protein
VCDTKDTLLHLTSILGTKDAKFLLLEIYDNGGLACNILSLRVGSELSSIHNGEIDTISEIFV